MKKIYYAHSMHLYNTNQEKRDVATLEKLGFEVLNPNQEEYQKGYLEYRDKHGGENAMDYFGLLIDKCEALAFRAHVDGKIPSGVGFEVNYAVETFVPVFELPTLIKSRNLDVEDTRLYLQLNGQR